MGWACRVAAGAGVATYTACRISPVAVLLLGGVNWGAVLGAGLADGSGIGLTEGSTFGMGIVPLVLGRETGPV